MNAQPHIVHGVFLSLFGVGTLLIGKSGVGKSDLALALIDRGHALIADDAVEFYTPDGHTLMGQSSSLLRGLLEIRNCGVLDIRAHFGDQAILEKCPLSLVIRLESSPPLHSINPEQEVYTLLNINVPCFSLSATATRPREILAEALVRHYQLMQQGINTAMQFIANHNHALQAST